MLSLEQELLRITFAAVLGIAMGFEREMKRKPLGLKTCLVISVTSSVLTVVSIDTAVQFNLLSPGHPYADPMRLAAQIVSGVGFLGAGVILRRNNEAISGLTSAAMVWAASGLGIAAGAGFYVEASVGVLLIIFSVELLPIFVRKLGPKTLRERDIQVSFWIGDIENLKNVRNQLSNLGIEIEHMKIRDGEGGGQEVVLLCAVEYHTPPLELFQNIRDLEPVRRLEVEYL